MEGDKKRGYGIPNTNLQQYQQQPQKNSNIPLPRKPQQSPVKIDESFFDEFTQIKVKHNLNLTHVFESPKYQL